MSRKKILMICLDFLPRVGGISYMAHQLANALSESGHQVTVIAPPGSHSLAGQTASYELVVDTQAKTSHREGRESLSEDIRIADFLEKTCKNNRPSYILLMHPFYYGVATVNFALSKGIPCGTTFYGGELGTLYRKPYNKRFSMALELILRPNSLRSRTHSVIARSNILFPISRYTLNLVKKVYGHEAATVIGCGVPRNWFNNEVSLTLNYSVEIKSGRQRACGIESSFLVIFVGRLVPSKNLDVVIRALRLSDTTTLAVVGTGPEEARLKRLAENLSVSNRVAWLGQMDDASKMSIVRASNALILPSRELESGHAEGFGLVLLEAASAGTVMIGARSGGITDVILNDEDGLLFDPEDEHELASLIDRLHVNENLCRSLTSRARDKIEKKFNWETIAEKIVSAFQNKSGQL